jgi:isopenicillin N synthase-like dioxygenase
MLIKWLFGNFTLVENSNKIQSPLWCYSYCFRSAGKKLIYLIAMALNLDEDYFEKVGALDTPSGFLRLLHYPGMLA